MSFLTRTLARPIRSSCSPQTVTLRSRPFHASSLRAALSESDHSRHEEKAAEIDHHKDDQLKKQDEGKGHWKRELASNSESAIKADRHETHDSEHDIEKLQKETSEAMEDDHEHAKK